MAGVACGLPCVASRDYSMTDTSRRSFLLGGMAATTAAAAGLHPAIARALAIPADRRSGTIADVDHVVILMQENRSFDHYFGTARGVNGFGDRFPIPLPPVAGSPRTVWEQQAADGRLVSPFHLATQQDFDLMRVAGTPHGWNDAQLAWDNGRMAQWPKVKTERAMGFYQREDIGFQFALSEAFTLCDAYHCSIQTGTNSNRLFLWTGTNDPSGTSGGPAISNSHDTLVKDGGAPNSYFWTSYVERLQAAGVDWRIYQDMADNFSDNPLAGFRNFRAAHAGDAGADARLLERGLSTHTLDAFRADALAGSLPKVSYMVAPAARSEHPGPSSPAQGAAYTAEVLDALTANPAVWARTVLLVMYDENDGFFDHVPPPAPPARAGDETAGASAVALDGEYHVVPSPTDHAVDLPELRGRPYGLGPRVPLFVISPWSRGGWINSQVFDHTSVIRFLEQRFGVQEPNISPWRRAVCGDLTSAFDFAHAETRALPAPLPDPRGDAVRAAAIKGQPSPLAPTGGALPRQEAGIRRSRALPYALEVRPQLGDGVIELTFQAQGDAAAVFHVYDRHALDLAPRRYTAVRGKPLSGRWGLQDGSYDLWVLGPNGFHRHFTGKAGEAVPQLSWQLARAQNRLTVELVAGDAVVTPNAYAADHAAWRGEGKAHQHWSLEQTGGWYDVTVTSPTAPFFAVRLAGRLETGRDTFTDPARG